MTWTNKDAVAHTVTSLSGSELDSGNIDPNGTFSHTFDSPGTFDYYCTIHLYMKGHVEVVPQRAGNAATSQQDQSQSDGLAQQAGNTSSTSIDVTETSFNINLSYSSAPAGKVTFHVSNQADAIPHQLVIIKTDSPADQLPTSNGKVDTSNLNVIGSTDNIQTGQSQDLTVDLDAGTYVLICNLPSHYQNGMRTSFTVQGSGSSGTGSSSNSSSGRSASGNDGSSQTSATPTPTLTATFAPQPAAESASGQSSTAAPGNSTDPSSSTGSTQNDPSVVIAAPTVIAVPWSAEKSVNVSTVTGRVTLGDQPVSNLQIRVGAYTLPERTNGDGTFAFPADPNTIRRYPVQVIDASQAQIGGRSATSQEETQLTEATGVTRVNYRFTDVTTSLRPDVTVVLSGTVSFADGSSPPPVVLYAYRLRGVVQNAQDQPVEGAIVSTQSQEFRWSLSEPSATDGTYRSFFWPTAQGAYKVVLVEGDLSFGLPSGRAVPLPYLSSSRLDVTLDRQNGTIAVSDPQAEEGVIYEGLLVCVAVDGQPVQPISATWPDKSGRFSLILPASTAGKTITFWQRHGYYFTRNDTKPGGDVDLSAWPNQIDTTTIESTDRLTLPQQ